MAAVPLPLGDHPPFVLPTRTSSFSVPITELIRTCLEFVTATVAAATREIRVRLPSHMMDVAPCLPRLELVSIIHWQTPFDYYTNNAMAAIPDRVVHLNLEIFGDITADALCNAMRSVPASCGMVKVLERVNMHMCEHTNHGKQNVRAHITLNPESQLLFFYS